MSHKRASGQQLDIDSDDSDIQEIEIITSRHPSPTPITKRRKSSPQMDPIPSYTPTPLHILEQRARSGSTAHQPSYNPRNTSASRSPPTNYNDYVPLVGPSPNIVSCESVSSSSISRPEVRTTRLTRNNATTSKPTPSAPPEPVAKKQNTQQDQPVASSSPAKPINSSYAEQPVMWSPQLPSQIPDLNIDKDEDYEKYKSPRITKQRVAHKPIVTMNRKNLVPQGTAKKVPAILRSKYLELIFNEYISCGHDQDEAQKESMKEEQAIATRAATKPIYVNLIASLKKRIREKAGALTQDNDPKYVNGNKVVSHSEILTGKVKGTFSIEKRRKISNPEQLSEPELYDRLQRYILPVGQLKDYGYPIPDDDNPNMRRPEGKDGQRLQLRAEFAPTYTCERCTKVYRVDPETGTPLSSNSKCIYHPGHLWNERINRALEKRYSCCKGDPSAGGCSSNPYHVHRGELELANYEGFVYTKPKPEKDPNNHGLYALDCEMCYTTYGLELTRVTVINYKYEVVYEKLVKPSVQILDYNTKFSGIKVGDLDNVSTSLQDVQRDLLELFSTKTILIGHSLDSDMKALKIFHQMFVDTAQLFPHKRGLPFKRALRTLMVENLRMIIQEDAGHDSKEDASAAFKLVMWKAKTDVPEKKT